MPPASCGYPLIMQAPNPVILTSELIGPDTLGH